MVDKKLEHYKRYGWKIDETNLATLPDDAPESAHNLAKYLTLQGRANRLKEYLSYVQEDGRLHGKFWPIGAWTHRMAHTSPNQANIPSVFSGAPRNAVEEIKERYDARFRALFEGDPWLVGTDADGIQLRILAHYLESQEYIDALVKGDKDKGTDIHSLNKRKLGSVCRDRDTAKTFIYAWVLGASVPKIAEILSCSVAQASSAKKSFEDSTPGLRRLKDIIIPRDASRGYFIGLDGRKVPCNSQHKMLAGYLQNGEAVVMKKATTLWLPRCNTLKIPFKLVDFVHDEWQTSVMGSREEAEIIGKEQANAITLAGKMLKVKCPLSGSYKIGKNWKETH